MAIGCRQAEPDRVKDTQTQAAMNAPAAAPGETAAAANEGRAMEPAAATQAVPGSSTSGATRLDNVGSEVANSAASAPAPVRPAFEEVTIPAGTSLVLALDTPVASNRSRVEEPVRAHVTRSVTVGERTVIPTGSLVSGHVTAAEAAGKVKGLAHIALRFSDLSRVDDPAHYAIETSSVSRTARATKRKDAVKVGGGALGGAIVGGIIGGKKGAAIGTAAGAGAGGAVVMSTRGEEVRLGKGAAITIKLSQPLTIRLPRG
ncbi:MAG: hypothetical protein QM736_14420 [Vicinamibacterales bacterium]